MVLVLAAFVASFVPCRSSTTSARQRRALIPNFLPVPPRHRLGCVLRLPLHKNLSVLPDPEFIWKIMQALCTLKSVMLGFDGFFSCQCAKLHADLDSSRYYYYSTGGPLELGLVPTRAIACYC